MSSSRPALMLHISDEQARALGHCVAAMARLERVVAGGVARLMATDPSSKGDRIAARMTARRARTRFLELTREWTKDPQLIERAEQAMQAAADLAERRNALVHAFFFQGLIVNPRSERPNLVPLDPEDLKAITREAAELHPQVVDLAVEVAGTPSGSCQRPMKEEA